MYIYKKLNKKRLKQNNNNNNNKKVRRSQGKIKKVYTSKICKKKNKFIKKINKR